MHKRPLQPTQRWKSADEVASEIASQAAKKENCPNRAVLDPNFLLHSMTYHPLGRKSKNKPKRTTADEDTQNAPTAQEANPGQSG
jgi:hypothetical protein